MENTKRLFEMFNEAINQITEDLEVERENVKIKRYETPKVGVDYIASGTRTKYTFQFHLRTKTDKEDPTSGEMKATLEVQYSESTPPFYFHENIDYLRGHPNFLSRWVSWAVFNFNLKHNPVNLQSLFGEEIDIKVYGLPGYNDPSEAELEIFIRGLLGTKCEKLIVYRFRHIGRPYLLRTFTYAFFPIGYGYFWTFFADFSGLDSGGSLMSHQHVEGLIELAKKHVSVERKNFDIEYEEMDTFLFFRSIDFRSLIREENLQQRLDLHSPILINEVEYKKFDDRLKRKEYPQALRDLRALLQQAEEELLKRKNIDFSEVKKPDVNKLAGVLIQNHIIDGRLQDWFKAFSAIANLASHRNFPSERDLSQENIKTRVLMTFLIGKYLLYELDETLRPPISFKKPKIIINQLR